METAAQRHIDGEFYPTYESMFKTEVSFANVCCRLELFKCCRMTGRDVSKTINVDAAFFFFFFLAKPTKFCVRLFIRTKCRLSKLPLQFSEPGYTAA